MKKTILTLICLCIVHCAAGQKVSRHYQDISMSKALQDLNQATTAYNINFMYNDLEHFRVTTDIRHKSIPDAIRQVIGFYPVRMTKNGRKDIFVECIHKTTHHLTGTIVDEHNQTVAYANIALYHPQDSTLLAGGVSNESGIFVIPMPQPDVLVRISYVGYKTLWQHCSSEHLGLIRLQPETQQLKGVMVSGQAPIVRRESGTIILDTRYIAGAINAADLLRYAPGVMFDNARIALSGTCSATLSVNGKAQRIGQQELMQLLKSYPAADIEKIEIIPMPNASLNTESNAGIINLVLKKRDNDYIGGSASFAHTQYESNDDEANASLTYNKGKLATSLNMAGNWGYTLYQETNYLNFAKRRQADDGRIKNNHLTVRWQMDYDLTSRLSLGAYAMIADGKRQLNVDGEYDILRPDSFVILRHDSIHTRIDRHEKTRNYAFSAYATQKIGRRGAKIDYTLDYYRMKLSDSRTSVGQGWLPYYSDNDIDHTVDNYSAKIDASVSDFKLGTQLALTHSYRRVDYHLQNNTTGYDDYTFNERIWTNYAEYDRHFSSRWQVNLGARYEHTWTHGEHSFYNSSQRFNYGHMLPFCYVSFTPSDSHQFSLSYSDRITRPNVINATPLVVWNDIYHSSRGNEELWAHYLHKAMISYTYRGLIGADIYLAYQPDKISNVAYLSNGEVINGVWDNSVDEQVVGLNVMLKFDRLSWLSAILTQGLSHKKATSASNYMVPEAECLNYSVNLKSSLFFGKARKWMGNLDFNYTTKEKDVVRELRPRYRLDIGLQYTFWKDRLHLSATCRNLIASRIKGFELVSREPLFFDRKLDYRQVRLTLTYNFGARLTSHQRHHVSDELQERTKNDF